MCSWDIYNILQTLHNVGERVVHCFRRGKLRLNANIWHGQMWSPYIISHVSSRPKMTSSIIRSQWLNNNNSDKNHILVGHTSSSTHKVYVCVCVKGLRPCRWDDLAFTTNSRIARRVTTSTIGEMVEKAEKTNKLRQSGKSINKYEIEHQKPLCKRQHYQKCNYDNNYNDDENVLLVETSAKKPLSQTNTITYIIIPPNVNRGRTLYVHP